MTSTTLDRYTLTHDHDVIDWGFSRTIVLTPHGTVVAREAALAQAVAGLVASIDEDHRATPADLLAAVLMPLDDLF